MHDQSAPSYQNEKPEWFKMRKTMSTKEQEDHFVEKSPEKQRCSQSREAYHQQAMMQVAGAA